MAWPKIHLTYNSTSSFLENRGRNFGKAGAAWNSSLGSQLGWGNICHGPDFGLAVSRRARRPCQMAVECKCSEPDPLAEIRMASRMTLDTPSSEEREHRYGEFVSLLARHDQSIRRFVRSLLPARDGVDDVMQETALECWRKFDDFAPAGSETASAEFIRWACVIARYKVLSWQRDQIRDRLVFRENVIEQLAQDAIENLDQHEHEKAAVATCLQKLNDDQRRLVLSVYSPGQSIARIAAETGEKARRLYTQLNAVRRQLLKCLQHSLDGVPGRG